MLNTDCILPACRLLRHVCNWVSLLIMLLCCPTAFAQSTFSNVVMSPTGGVVASGEMMAVTVTGTVKSATAVDAVKTVELFEGGTKLDSTAYVVTYDAASGNPVNTDRTINLVASLPAGEHVLKLRAITVSGQNNDTAETLVSVTSAALLHNAKFLSQDVPATMVAGQNYIVSVTMQNTGTSTWTTDGAQPYALGAQNPQDNLTWGVKRASLPAPVAPGESVTIIFPMIAPATAATYNFRWGMLHEGDQWFGGLTDNIAVKVTAATGAPTVTFGSPKVDPSVKTLCQLI
jgi:hypothetical protein